MAGTKKFRFEVACPVQGVQRSLLTLEEIGAWMKVETDFWSSLPLPDQFTFERQGYNLNLKASCVAHLRTITAGLTEDAAGQASLDAWLGDCSQLKFLLAHGRLAPVLQKLAGEDANAGALLAATFSAAALRRVDRDLTQALVERRGLVLLSPGTLAAADLVDTAANLADAAEAREVTVSSQQELDDYLAKTRHDVSELEKLLRDKLQLEASATYWEGLSVTASIRARWALGFFIVGTLIALGGLWAAWGSITTLLLNLSKSSTTGFSLSGFALITAPVLGIGWILRQISRMFVQNLAISDDAAQRKVMVMTYLALGKDKETAPSKEERALILNALFRPAPPHTGDDGPPMGLLDFLRK